MNKIPGKCRLLSRLISLSAAGALVGTAGAYAADNQNITGQEKNDAPPFSEVDRNQDQQVVWTEIVAIYDDDLRNARWEERDVMDRYDADRNNSLDENEYLVFVTALAADPATNLSAESVQQSMREQQDSSIASTGRQQRSSAQPQGSTQQSQQQTQQDSMAGNQQEQGAGSTTQQNPSVAGSGNQQSNTTRQQDSREDLGAAGASQQDGDRMAGTAGQGDDEMAGTTGQQNPGTADYYDQESQTSTGGAQSPRQGQRGQQGQGMDDQSVTQTNQNQGGAASQQPDGQQQGQAGSTTAIIAITDIPDITAEDLRDRQVLNLGGEEIGEVEDVVLGTDGTISGLVVSVGGFWNIGDKDIFASANELRVSGDQIIWETTLDEDALKELPEYEAPEVSAIE